MHVVNIIKVIVLFCTLLICSYTDYKKGKIFNIYLALSLLLFVLIQFITYIMVIVLDKSLLNNINNQTIDSIFGLLIGFIIGIVFYIVGIFKGGDAKLLPILGVYIGKEKIFFHLSMIIIVAGIGALIVMIQNKVFIKKIKRVVLYFKGIVLMGKFERYTVDPNDNIKFPFAVYVLLGEIISYIINYKELI